MAEKSEVKAVEEQTEKSSIAPDGPTWSEEEVQKIAEFVNYAYSSIQISTSLKDAKMNLSKAQTMFNMMHVHVSKLESYIFDYKAHLQPKQAVKK